MRKYFVYELKKSAFIIACLAVIAIVIYLAPLIICDKKDLFEYRSAYLAIVSSIGGVLAVFVPVWVYHYKMKKRSVDMFFSLSLSHTKVLAVKFLLGLVAVFLPYTLSYWLGAFVVMGRATIAPYIGFIFQPVYYLALYGASIIPILLLYVISSFVYTRANSMLDGILFIVFWMFAAALIAQALYQPIWNVTKVSICSEYFFPFKPLDFVTAYFQRKIIISAIPSIYTYDFTYLAVSFTLTTLLGVGSTIGLFVGERRVKAENTEQVSNSWFGYRVMIPLYTVCLMTFVDSNYTEVIILYVLVAAGSFMLTALYKRTMKIGKIQTIVYFASLALGLLLSYLCWI